MRQSHLPMNSTNSWDGCDASWRHRRSSYFDGVGGRKAAFFVCNDLDVLRLNNSKKLLQKVLTFGLTYGIIIMSRGEGQRKRFADIPQAVQKNLKKLFQNLLTNRHKCGIINTQREPHPTNGERKNTYEVHRIYQ